MKWVCIRENLKDFKTHFSSAIISMSLRNLVNMYININIHIKIYKYYIYMYIYIYMCVCVCVCFSIYICIYLYDMWTKTARFFVYYYFRVNVLRWCLFVHLFDAPFKNSPYNMTMLQIKYFVKFKGFFFLLKVIQVVNDCLFHHMREFQFDKMTPRLIARICIACFEPDFFCPYWVL